MIKVFATSNMTYTPFKGFHQIDIPYLSDNNVIVVEDVNDADVIVSQHFKQLKPYFLKYLNRKKYLIWTLEPRFNTHTSSIKKFFFGLMKVHVMNVYTGDVFVNPLCFHNEKIDQHLSLLNHNFKLSNKTLVGLMSYYKGLNTESVMYKGNDVDMIKKRTLIALYGHKVDKMHIYGKGWPDGMSREDSRDGNWVESKSHILDPYHFNLSFENTAATRYTTEKIWDSIANCCLPVYYAKGTDIFNLFPEDSFIDYSQIESPEKLFYLIDNMSNEEYITRMNKCIMTYNSVSNKSVDEKNNLRKESLEAIVKKICNLKN